MSNPEVPDTGQAREPDDGPLLGFACHLCGAFFTVLGNGLTLPGHDRPGAGECSGSFTRDYRSAPSGDTVQAPDVAALLARCDAEDWSAGEFGWIQTTEIRALLGTDTTPDRLAWISEAGETAAAERQARYQETACARRPAEERPDA